MIYIFDLGKFGVAVELDQSQFSTGLKDVEKSIGKTSSKLGGFAKSVGKIATGIGVFKLVDKGISMITSSFDRAISRVDALNQFPKVLQQMGYGADEARNATKKLVDGIDGLPTTLDDITGDVQRLVNVFQDVDKSADSAVALNNAFLASGASSDEASRGLDQYIKMLSTGKVNMTSWQTLQETMPYALQEAAEAFEFTGKTAQNDFYEALQSGEITMDEFNDKIIELSDEQGGFAEVAQEATKGINTSWTNIKTAIANGVATSIQAFDDWLESAGFGGISGVLDGIKEKIGIMFNTVNEYMPIILEWFTNLFTTITESTAFITLKEVIFDVVELLAELWERFEDTGILEIVKDIFHEIAEAILSIDFSRIFEEIVEFLDTWSPLIAGIGAGIIAFQLITGAIALWTTATTIATGVGGAFAAVLAFITSPIGVAVVAIGALIAIGVALYKNWDKVKATTEKVWNSIASFFGTVWNGIKSIFTSVVNAIVNFVKTSFNGIKSMVSSIFNGIKSFFTTVWSGIKSIFTGTIGAIVSTVTSKFNSIKDAMFKPINAAKDLIKGVIDSIKGFFSGMKLSFPKIKMPKLPKFSLKGKFSLMPPKVPKLSIDWFKDGGIMTKPTAFGRNGNSIMAGGEAGPEAILPLNARTLGTIGDKIYRNMSGTNTGANNNTTTNNSNKFEVNVTMNEVNDSDKFFREINDGMRTLGVKFIT